MQDSTQWHKFNSLLIKFNVSTWKVDLNRGLQNRGEFTVQDGSKLLHDRIRIKTGKLDARNTVKLLRTKLHKGEL